MTKLYIAIAVAVAVVGGGTWYVTRDEGPSSAEQSPGASVSASVEASTKGNLRGLLASGSPQKCEFEVTTYGVTSRGTVYVANGKMRGDFSATHSGGTTVGHMVVADSTVSFWSEGQAQGFTMNIDSTTAEAQANAALSLDQNLSYDCDAWRVDEAQFRLPANVQFTSMANLMPSGGVQVNTQQMQAACGACDRLSGAQKDQCRAALQCK
jgi:hypothetical protein